MQLLLARPPTITQHDHRPSWDAAIDIAKEADSRAYKIRGVLLTARLPVNLRVTGGGVGQILAAMRRWGVMALRQRKEIRVSCRRTTAHDMASVISPDSNGGDLR